jgi:hypothetical protein
MRQYRSTTEILVKDEMERQEKSSGNAFGWSFWVLLIFAALVGKFFGLLGGLILAVLWLLFRWIRKEKNQGSTGVGGLVRSAFEAFRERLMRDVKKSIILGYCVTIAAVSVYVPWKVDFNQGRLLIALDLGYSFYSSPPRKGAKIDCGRVMISFAFISAVAGVLYVVYQREEGCRIARRPSGSRMDTAAPTKACRPAPVGFVDKLHGHWS